MHPPSPLRHWTRAFAVGSLVHLTLPDFAPAAWWPAAAIEGAGALLLLVRPSAAGFALCLAGTLWTLFGLRDVLTQSMYLSWVAGAALFGALTRAPAAKVLDVVRVLTASTYLIAAFHKLNADFFGPQSCAPHAWDQVVAHWHLPAALGQVGPWLPAAAVALEVALGVAIWRRSAWMWPLGVAFHLPLTVTLAPAFGAVMLSGYVAATPARAAVRWRRVWRKRRAALALAATLGAVAELTLSGGLAEALKVGAAAAILVGAALAFGPTRGRRTPAIAWAVTALWCLHGATPYLGLQTQHTAAMLSNLRIDQGCWNHLLVPEGLRWADPYLRVDAASFGIPRPDRVEVLRGTLWSPPALAAMHDNWCVPENRPIRLAGTWRGAPFAIADLCADDWAAALPAGAWLPGFQRFQKNLPRACPAACVH